MTLTSQQPRQTEGVAEPNPAISVIGASILAPRRRGRSMQSVSRSHQILAYTLLILGSLAFLIPFYFVVNGSFKSEAAVQAGDFIRPAFLKSAPPGESIPIDSVKPVIRDALSKTIGPAGSITALFQNADITIADAKIGDEQHEIRIESDGTLRSNVIIAGGWRNYPNALSPEKMDFWPALSNTVVITTFCVFGQILSCSLVGFGFARFRFKGRSILFMIMLSTMMLPAQVTMIPVFVLFKSLHMIDTFWPLILPAWLASPFFVFMFRQFFSQLPEELIEAARIDGASNTRIYWQLMLPLSGPVIAIVAIYTFLGTWNDFLNPIIYLNSPSNRTLALALNAFRGLYGISDAHLLMAASVVCMLPCVVLFFACQKYFVESVATTGGK